MAKKKQSSRLTKQHKESHGAVGIFGEEAKLHDITVGEISHLIIKKLKNDYPQLLFRYRERYKTGGAMDNGGGRRGRRRSAVLSGQNLRCRNARRASERRNRLRFGKIGGTGLRSGAGDAGEYLSVRPARNFKRFKKSPLLVRNGGG